MLEGIVNALIVIYDYVVQSGGSVYCSRFVKDQEFTYNFKANRSVDAGELLVTDGTPGQNRAERIS
jgi:hypothetical protein